MGIPAGLNYKFGKGGKINNYHSYILRIQNPCLGLKTGGLSFF